MLEQRPDDRTQAPREPGRARPNVRGIPSIWLIGPDGKVLAKNLHGGAIKEAVGEALASPK